MAVTDDFNRNYVGGAVAYLALRKGSDLQSERLQHMVSPFGHFPIAAHESIDQAKKWRFDTHSGIVSGLDGRFRRRQRPGRGHVHRHIRRPVDERRHRSGDARGLRDGLIEVLGFPMARPATTGWSVNISPRTIAHFATSVITGTSKRSACKLVEDICSRRLIRESTKPRYEIQFTSNPDGPICGYRTCKNLRGFTLIELVIVVMILGMTYDQF